MKTHTPDTTRSTAGHTPNIPGPYHADGRKIKAISHGQSFTIARCCDGSRFTPESGPDLAAFIVRACNSHAALVEALERTAKHLQFLADNIIDDETAAYAACIEVCRQARAAIAKATEGQQ